MKTLAQSKLNYDAAAKSSTLISKYEAGVNGGGDWNASTQTNGAKAKYDQAVSAAITADSWRRACKQITTADFKKACIAKSANLKTGMVAAVDKWETNYSPIYSAVAAVVDTLTPSGSDVSDNIDNRMKPVVLAAIKASLVAKGHTVAGSATLSNIKG